MTNFTSAWAPASLSNLGPGFDALGVALTKWGDNVSIALLEGSDIKVSFAPGSKWSGPTEAKRNTASVAAIEVAKMVGYQGGISIEIDKGFHAGSGLGSSAASAVAGAMAMNGATGETLSKEDLIPAVMKGESIVSPSIHGDNVLPSLLGGFILLQSSSPERFRRIEGASDIFFAIVLPDLEVLTSNARQHLPDSIPLDRAVDHAARLGLLINSINTNDTAAIGALIMSDDLIEPTRSKLLPPYQRIKEAALAAGASGCALSGSGPAMYAVCGSSVDASHIELAMSTACRNAGYECSSITDTVNLSGATLTK